MSVRIGHASLDENKKTKNGAAGDQTGSEVCIRSWYSKPWGFVLKPKTAAVSNTGWTNVSLELDVSDLSGEYYVFLEQNQHSQ